MKDKIDNLYQLYPYLFYNDSVINISDGWKTIVKDLIVAIDAIESLDTKNPDIKPTIFHKIETKQGWLNIEYQGGDELIGEIVRYSTVLSFKTCELCGKMGTLYCSDKYMHWSDKKTLCLSHAIKLYYYSMTK
mgnify:FL=1|jgi:hypothetical protein